MELTKLEHNIGGKLQHEKWLPWGIAAVAILAVVSINRKGKATTPMQQQANSETAGMQNSILAASANQALMLGLQDLGQAIGSKVDTATATLQTQTDLRHKEAMFSIGAYWANSCYHDWRESCTAFQTAVTTCPGGNDAAHSGDVNALACAGHNLLNAITWTPPAQSTVVTPILPSH